jgi:hypothetical protein
LILRKLNKKGSFLVSKNQNEQRIWTKNISDKTAINLVIFAKEYYNFFTEGKLFQKG